MAYFVQPHEYYVRIEKMGGKAGGAKGGAAGLIPYERRIEIFWTKIQKTDDCWNWLGNTDRNGYGIYFCLRKMIKAHRFSWEIHFGPIPDGLWVLHHCDNPSCVRPEHLFLGTNLDNINDSIRKGRFSFQTWQGKTHCKNGHPLIPENIKFVNSKSKKPYRCCRQCRRDAYKRWSPKRKRYGSTTHQ